MPGWDQGDSSHNDGYEPPHGTGHDYHEPPHGTGHGYHQTLTDLRKRARVRALIEDCIGPSMSNVKY